MKNLTKTVILILIVLILSSGILGCKDRPTYVGDAELTDDDIEVFEKWENIVKNRTVDINSIEYCTYPYEEYISNGNFMFTKKALTDSERILEFLDFLNEEKLSFEKYYTQSHDEYRKNGHGIRFLFKTENDNEYFWIAIFTNGVVYLNTVRIAWPKEDTPTFVFTGYPDVQDQDNTSADFYKDCIYRSTTKAPFDKLNEMLKKIRADENTW